MKHHGTQLFGHKLRRLLAGLLCAAVMCGLLPGISLTGTAQAAVAQLPWSDRDLEDLHSYGIMNGDDGGMRPNDNISRAEFTALVNRALGYKEKAAKVPFQDVPTSEWFYDDVSISYNMGYINGVTPTSAAPRATLSREEALVIMARNLMLQPKVGESFSFADARSFNEYSRGYIDPAIEAGLIDADPYNNFSPKQAITRGEMAGMMNRAMGIPIQNAGVQSLGTVNGNMTITTSGVSLRNTTINGDLYLTGGIGLGDVLLDNVTVNGKIIDSGAGLSEKGEISVILNNVTADELIVDSMRNQTISLSAKGNTLIPKTSLRTPSRVEDSTATSYGLRLIEIDGEEKTSAVLSGNIKEVVNKTPGSSLNIGEGVAEKVTVDEAATGSTVTVGKDARIKYLNLDAGVAVTGSGSVDSLTVSANGASLTLPLAPDEIIIAPGVISNINKQQMDSAAAAEASSRPRLLPGYPGTDNLAPTSVTALFKTNKPGTVYWAITARADGSPSEENIISPPSYSNTIVKSGSVKAKASNTEYTAKISGLTADGSYYLSVIMMDDKGTRSTMKVTAFTTPDNSTPAFSKGYPEEFQISEKDAQFAFMTTKDCYLYYAVLPKGGTTPRAIDFKTGSISGNLGYGVVKMAKDSPAYIFVNDVSLEEKQSYVLHVWLNDIDGAKSSAVKSINFTTQDRTDPIITNLRQTKSTANSVTAAYALNEPGTLYWAAVKAGDTSFMSPSTSGNSTSNEKWLESRAAMERIIAGTGAIKSGKSSVAASKVGADVTFTASGLNSKTTGTSAYDLYYVAVDTAGNWSKPIQSVTIYTDDKSKPTVELKFTSYSDDLGENTANPLADTNIRLVFSKPVRVVELENGVPTPYNLLELNSNKEKLAEVLRKYVKFYLAPNSTGTGKLVTDKKDNNTDWVIDYTKARVYQEGTSMVLEFPNNVANPDNSALRLANGAWYYFEVCPQQGDFQDTTNSHNEMAPANPKSKPPLRRFQVKSAQIDITSLAVAGDKVTYRGIDYPVDIAFQFDPISTATSPEATCYDVLLWSDTSMEVNLFRKERTETAWTMIGTGSKTNGAFKFTVPKGDKSYISVAAVGQGTNGITFDALRSLNSDKIYDFAVSIASYGNEIDRKKWNIAANMEVTVAAGAAADLRNIAMINGRPATWTGAISSQNGRLESIGNPDPYTAKASVLDSVAPVLADLNFTMRDTSGTIDVALDRPGEIYWAVVKLQHTTDPQTKVDTITGGGRLIAEPEDANKELNDLHYPSVKTPWEGAVDVSRGLTMTSPGSGKLIDDPPADVTKELYTGVETYTGAAVTITLDGVKKGLDADSWYAVYMMFRGNVFSPKAVGFRFKTHPPYEPILTLSTQGTTQAGMVNATVTESSADVFARLIPDSSLADLFYNRKFNAEDLAKAGLSFTDYFKTDVTVPNSVQNNTILNALITATGNKGVSQFDEYASDNLKNYVATLIKSGASTGSIASDVSQIAMGASRDISFRNLPLNEQYFCVAVAENTSDPTKRGFRAVSPVEVVDTNPATVNGASGTLRLVAIEDKDNHKTTYVLTGTVTISYKGYLYVKDELGATRKFTQGGKQQNQPFFLVTTDNGTTTWAGAASITSINQTGMFEVRPIGGSSVAAQTQSLVLSVKDTRSPEDEQAGLPEGFVYETIYWTKEKVLDDKGNVTGSTWIKPDYPVVSGDVLFPTEIVNRNGTTPTNSGKISYTNLNRNQTGTTVTVTYK